MVRSCIFIPLNVCLLSLTNFDKTWYLKLKWNFTKFLEKKTSSYRSYEHDIKYISLSYITFIWNIFDMMYVEKKYKKNVLMPLCSIIVPLFISIKSRFVSAVNGPSVIDAKLPEKSIWKRFYKVYCTHYIIDHFITYYFYLCLRVIVICLFYFVW